MKLFRITLVLISTLMFWPMASAEESTSEQSPVVGTDDPAYNTADAGSKRYVTDTLWLQLRTGPGSGYRILQAVESGEHLILVGENPDNGYSLVRTGKGREGWVLTRYLDQQPVAKEKLILTERELETTSSQLATAKARIEELENQLQTTQQQRDELQQQSESVTSELQKIKTVSADAINLSERFQRLNTRTQELEIQLEASNAENAQLRDARDFNYLLYGGGLVILGILAGLIIPSLRSKKNTGWA